MEGSVKCSANYVALTPISFLERAAIVYRDRVSVIHGDLKFTWAHTRERCVRLASALHRLGISRRDVVAALTPNNPAMYELHFGVPMAGAVLCPLNIRHDSSMLSKLLKHSNTKAIFVDHQFLHIAKAALKLLSETGSGFTPLLIIISSNHGDIVVDDDGKEALEYESLLKSGRSDFEIIRPNDELEQISLNYTSGTTSSPKGVVFSHRGAYLNSLAVLLSNEMGSFPVYLWAVQMFHCHGWGLIWALPAQGGTNICLREITTKAIFESIKNHGVTHMSGAPTILNMIVNCPPSDRIPLPGKVNVMTGGAPPPAQVILGMEELGFNVTNEYGLTETYGPGTLCIWKPEWNPLPPETRAKLKSRQGLIHSCMEEVAIKDPETMKSVPSDGKTMGEVMFRGNTIMIGYLNDAEATEEAFKGGWFRTGDLGVRHSDGYIELKDRSKDIVISGEENISTIEVESVIFSHPSVLEAAVVGRPDDYWGETPCAFVKLKDGQTATADEIIRYCCDRLPHYMAPKTVVFEELPKTSTGKTQKYVLRKKAEALGSL